MYRIGQGIDFHRLAEGRDLWLGGVKIPYNRGAVGHSDADVLLHAICDAMLGAVNLGDIGHHFPDTDPTYKNIDSKILLKQCYKLVHEQGYWLVNIDSTVMLQEPKIKPYIAEMREAIAHIVQLLPQDVSVKATTTEHLGFVGSGEGIVAMANVLLQKIV
jgi:2-C-methyl-D-erythritol 2,4-cyclodiphosphate synthase